MGFSGLLTLDHNTSLKGLTMRNWCFKACKLANSLLNLLQSQGVGKVAGDADPPLMAFRSVTTDNPMLKDIFSFFTY